MKRKGVSVNNNNNMTSNDNMISSVI
jgi:hypothetical protein